MAEKKHYIGIDVLRVIAILAVVLIHTTTKTIQISLNALLDVPFSLFLNQVSRFAVTLFFLISGFVLELNYDSSEKYITYLKKKLNRIVVPYVFWSAIYYLIVYPHTNIGGSINTLALGSASYQLYFIPTLLIFYLFFPLIHTYFKFIWNRWVIVCLFILQLTLLYYDYYIHPLPLAEPFRIAVLNYFVFIFGIVVCRNYEFVKRFIDRWKLVLLCCSVVLAYGIYQEGLNGFLATSNYLKFYSQWRPSILVYMLCLAGFLYWLVNRKRFDTHIIKTLSKLSFFIFFIHVAIIELLVKFIGTNYFNFQNAQKVWFDPVLFLTVSLLSFGIAYITHKIPFLAKITG